MLVSLDILKDIVAHRPLYYTAHAQEQMALRRILDAEVRETMLGQSAGIIEQYPEDKYSPSCLIYGVTRQGRILHVQANNQALIVTVYEPDLNKWHDDFKTRRGL